MTPRQAFRIIISLLALFLFLFINLTNHNVLAASEFSFQEKGCTADGQPIVKFQWRLAKDWYVEDANEMWLDVSYQTGGTHFDWTSTPDPGTNWWGYPLKDTEQPIYKLPLGVAVATSQIVEKNPDGSIKAEYEEVVVTVRGNGLRSGQNGWWRINIHRRVDADNGGVPPPGSSDYRVWWGFPDVYGTNRSNTLHTKENAEIFYTPKCSQPTPTPAPTPRPTSTPGPTPTPAPTAAPTIVTPPPISLGKPPATLCSLNDIFRSIVQILTLIAGFAFFIMILVGGYRYLMSGGNPKTTAEARNVITFAVIGLILMFLAWIIIIFVQSLRGGGVPDLRIFNICPFG